MSVTAGDTDLEAFRAEARAWLAANFPTSLKGKAGIVMSGLEGGRPAGDAAAWLKAVGEKGWTTPTWPAEYGGGGLSGKQARVLQEEMDLAGAFNPLLGFGMGITMIGPTILDYGTEAERGRFVSKRTQGRLRHRAQVHATLILAK